MLWQKGNSLQRSLFWVSNSNFRGADFWHSIWWLTHPSQCLQNSKRESSPNRCKHRKTHETTTQVFDIYIIYTTEVQQPRAAKKCVFFFPTILSYWVSVTFQGQTLKHLKLWGVVIHQQSPTIGCCHKKTHGFFDCLQWFTQAPRSRRFHWVDFMVYMSLYYKSRIPYRHPGSPKLR